jgi:hypothetical protein
VAAFHKMFDELSDSVVDSFPSVATLDPFRYVIANDSPG